MVVQTWNSFSFSDRNGMIRFKKKLQELKKSIYGWIKDKNNQLASSKRLISDEMRAIDKKLEEGGVSDSLLLRRNVLKCNLHDIKSMEAADSLQKFKINFPFPNKLSQDQVDDLERGVSREEIQPAVWDCGENKTPGPDGYTFEFFRKFWNSIGPDLCAVVELFFINGSFSRGCNSSFIALIPKTTDAKFVNDYRPISLIGSVYKVVTNIMANRLAMVIKDIVSDTQSAFVANKQILDCPFILNEVLQWCKRKNKKVMFFKVDFAKAYDSGRWDFLIDVLEAFSFVCSAVNDGLFSGIRIHDYLSLSHLFYADDALFIGEWSDVNLRGCTIMENKFRYLGVMVGNCMSRHKAWEDVVTKLRSCLSKWKAKTLSIGGRLTLLKSVLAIHGPLLDSHSIHSSSIWSSIIKEVQVLKSKGIDFLDHCSKRVRDGSGTPFWVDRLKGGKPFRDTFPQLLALESNRQITVKEKMSSALDSSFRRHARGGVEQSQYIALATLINDVSLFPSSDCWVCSLSKDGVFRVKDTRNVIDEMFLSSQNDSTRWVKTVPIKINIFNWRARCDGLPTRSNLIRRGVSLATSSCPICLAGGGTSLGNSGLRSWSGILGSLIFG
uniref:RNA-directed DNA polymerase, eukaryota n=1 Tax=Tanacetum cinerariifolium TaxID=118510 RepID=A0A6L2JSC6_TANCI|nr:RNA-directed DNA polymerase, eukaryota [Tanacetum cinerariifolium]